MIRSPTSRHGFVLAVLLGSIAPSTSALAQSEADLAAARALFAEALHDEEEGRVAVALEKFRRVRDVRDTAPVEYRIGTCEEGLGRLTAAATTYTAAVRLGSEITGSEEVAAGARARLVAVQKRIGHLTLSPAPSTPADREVLVDGSVPATLNAIAVDPGPHVVTARASGALPFRTAVMVPEGGDVTVSVVLEPAPPSAASSAPPPSGARTAGWISLVGGGALLGASGVVLLVRMNDIDTLNAACPPPRGDCRPGSSQTDLTATRNRALALGPTAIGLAVGGAVAAGVGLFLLLRTSSGAPVAVTGFEVHPTGVAMRGAF